MSTLTVKVCEECGGHSTTGDGWLVISAMDIRFAKGDGPLVNAEEEIDLCSFGCVVRYVSKALDAALHERSAERREDREDRVEKIAAFM